MLDNYEFCREHLQILALDDLHPPRLLTGNDLIAMGFTPGKIIKRYSSCGGGRTAGRTNPVRRTGNKLCA
jgi:hypothetical protein